MKLLLDRINKLKKVNPLTKHEQLVNAIIDTIEAKELKKGDRLPSINKMVSEVGYARKTIVRAYEDLKGKGVVESKNFKGYYIATVNTKTKLRVALVLYAFHSFQEEFYNTFREELGKRYIINVFFHHNNIDVFKDILTRISGRYGMFVIAPIQVPEISTILNTIPAEKLLIIDRYLSMPTNYSYITQEFENSTYNQLKHLLPEIKKYDEFILFYKEDSDYPKGILKAFNKFIKDFKIRGLVKESYTKNSIEEGTLYFFIDDTNLWEVLRDTKRKGYAVGTDIGVLAHNDTTIKEIIFGGITTISTDFKKMARESAKYVKTGDQIHEIIPSELFQRNSL
jgi:DNA-binding transcriptional regulator YhcF (GntR family)